MNKLGFYIENTLVPGLREAIRDVKPPTILIHAKDRGLCARSASRFRPIHTSWGACSSSSNSKRPG